MQSFAAAEDVAQAGSSDLFEAPTLGTVETLSIVLFTCGRLGFEAAAALRSIPEVASVTVVYAPYRTTRRTGVDRIRHILRYNTRRGLLRRTLRRLWPGGNPRDGSENELPLNGESVLCFDDFHSEACIQAVSELAPDLGVIVGTYILDPSIYDIPRLGSINLHTGKAPQYRGSAPAFWELYNGESSVGITIHRVAEQVDSGSILLQRNLPLNPAPLGNPLRYIERYRRTVLHPHGIRLLTETVSRIVNGTVEETVQDETDARTYRMPDRRQIVELKRRVSERRSSLTTRRVKTVLGWLAFQTGLHRVLLRNRALIVLFHRVDDAYAGNPISCTTDEFKKYCKFFKQHFDVVGLTGLIDDLSKGANLSRKLAITFDDGYADNLEAGGILKNYGLPACFYVASGFIDSERDGWWDAERGLRSYWMKWDDVRQLAEWGFEIGGHTVNHVDLGKVSGEEAVQEIVDSREVLQRELGEQVVHFSYPYGGRDNITPENRQAIREAGFTSCTSAYGGAVTPESDIFDLRRVAVSPWHISPWQLGFELLFERTRSSGDRT